MKLLLTSGGVTNRSIRAALVDLLGRPIEECNALCVPTATYGHPGAGPRAAWRFISGHDQPPRMTGLGWKTLGVLELTALPTLPDDRWLPLLRETDVLLVDGGDAAYLCHHLRASGVVDLFPSLPDMVWVGVSAGSMVMTPRIGPRFVTWESSAGDETLGVVDFSIFPHLNYPGFTYNTTAHAERWAADIDHPAYAIDDETAIRVVDGAAEVISEGEWRFFER